MVKALLATIILCAVASYVSAAPVVINVDMTGEKEPNGSGGLNAGSLGSHATGTVTLNPDNDTISWFLETTAIQGTSFTGFHIHGPVPTPATLTTNVGVYRGFPTPTGNPGTPMTISGSIDLAFDPDLGNKIDNILGNLTGSYINLHTNTFGGGAVRSQLPEPTTMTLLACSALGLVLRRRKI